MYYKLTPGAGGAEVEADYSMGSTDMPEIEARVSEKRALIKIHSDRRKGLLVKVLAEVEKLNLVIVNTNVVPFGSSALDITITAEMGKEINLAATDIVGTLRPALQAFAK